MQFANGRRAPITRLSIVAAKECITLDDGWIMSFQEDGYVYDIYIYIYIHILIHTYIHGWIMSLQENGYETHMKQQGTHNIEPDQPKHLRSGGFLKTFG